VWPRGLEDTGELSRIAQRAILERKGIVARADVGDERAPSAEPRVLLAYPVVVKGKFRGAAALRIGERPQIQLQAAMRQLQWGTSWLQNWVLRGAADPREVGTERLTAVLELTGLALEEPGFRGAATAVVTELAARLGCDRVSLGFVAGKQVKVHALSHSAQFGKQMNLIRSIGMAMGEAVDQHSVLTWPESGDSGRHVFHAHESLARSHGDGAICSVPFVDREGHAFGAITFERATAEPFDEATVELCDSVASLLGPILHEKQKNDRLLITKLGDSLWTQVKRLVGPRYAIRKLVAFVLLALALFLTFARGSYRVSAKTTLEGEVRRAVTAPFRGFVFEAPVRGGEIVSAGQVMAQLDVRDLRLEYSRWSSEREQYLAEHRRAMAEGDRAARNVLEKKMGQAEARIALLEEQIERATITAPFDGLVVSGDLSQSLSAPVDVGDLLFEVAPLDAYRVMLQVDERDIRDIHEGQTGELMLTAMPGTRLPFKVTRVVHVSQPEEGRNYFTVEGSLEEVSARLRPGMEGFSKVDVDRRRLVWIWTHDLFDWIRIKTWRWLP
jgi:multidrug resistance efflux pump